MKPNCAFSLFALTACLLAGPALAQTPDYDAIARRIVQTTARVQPGEVVGVSGGVHALPLLEALTIEVLKAGGKPVPMFMTDRIERARFTEMPEEHLRLRHPGDEELLDDLDVHLILPAVEDADAVYRGVPEERFALQTAAYEGFAHDLDASGVRDVHVGFPSAARARVVGLDPARHAALHWAALDVDYEAIGRAAAALAERFERGREVRITTPTGTDVTVALQGRHVFRADGVADLGATSYLDRTENLPTGHLTVVPTETSAEGAVVVPHTRCRGDRLSDVQFEFDDGVMRGLMAEPGAECLEQTLAPYDGPKDRLGLIEIGLNPALRPIVEDEVLYLPGVAAGLVVLRLGANALHGGDNDTWGGMAFPLVGATVAVDGEVVVRDGRLLVDGL